MPCSDGYGPTYLSDDETRISRKKLRSLQLLEAMLCGICTVLEAPGKFPLKGIDQLPKILDKIDWEEVGVTRDVFEKWWKDHKAADARRRADELRKKTAASRKAAARNAALAKLSPADRAALGLK